MNPFSFGTKAETLELLRPLVRRGRLCPQLHFRVAEWRDDREAVLTRLLAEFGSAELIIRSSTLNEDGLEASHAGRYTSVAGILADRTVLSDAIETVINSYGPNAADDQVLVQPMVARVALSGVITTRDLTTGAPYYVINYDESGRTDHVTRGLPANCIQIRRNAIDSVRSPRIAELEIVSGCPDLDIEFCIDAAEEVYILQVRRSARRIRRRSPGWPVPLPDSSLCASPAAYSAGSKRLERGSHAADSA